MKMEISLGLFPDNSYDPIFPAGTRLEPESVIGGVGGASKEPERDERDERDARDARDTQGTHGARVFIQYIAGSLAQCTAFGGWRLLCDFALESLSLSVKSVVNSFGRGFAALCHGTPDTVEETTCVARPMCPFPPIRPLPVPWKRKLLICKPATQESPANHRRM